MDEVAHSQIAPALIWTFPFAVLLLAIAFLPLIPRLAHWWDRNRNKFLVSVVLALVTSAYFAARGRGFHGSEPGISAALAALSEALLADYVPFIVLLFSLYAISGGIYVGGYLPARPLTNFLILALGAMIASFVGTTGATMLLIRPLLQANRQRKHVVHTMVFFIFLVSNVGGLLLPVGDPPLFLGYLRGVPFLWTMRLFPQWALCISLLLAVYAAVEWVLYRRENKADLEIDPKRRVPLRITGSRNFVFLAGVILAVALLVPGQKLVGTNWVVPEGFFIREWVQLALTGISLLLTSKRIYKSNAFNLYPIAEVACLFFGIFITMQVPIEILRIRGPELGLTTGLQFFWATGVLSSVLDNAPTYVVFFETAASLGAPGQGLGEVIQTTEGPISTGLLTAISCGAVFMGAYTYIGNGPNFMAKSIAEYYGVRMPSFFGYMVYSSLILLPILAVVSLVFFR